MVRIALPCRVRRTGAQPSAPRGGREEESRDEQTACFLRRSARRHCLAAPASAATCDPAQFGAHADGVTKDTAAIQQAIDACAAKGGGTVTLTHGTYLSAPIILKSNITLDIAAGATLLGSPDHGNYPAMTVFREPGRQSLISAANAHDIAITGEGAIDGNGKSWWADTRGKRPSGVMGEVVFRPRLIVFDHCRHIRINGVTVQNSPSWQIVPYYSDDVTINHIKVLAPPNSPTPTPSTPSPLAMS